MLALAHLKLKMRYGPTMSSQMQRPMQIRLCTVMGTHAFGMATTGDFHKNVLEPLSLQAAKHFMQALQERSQLHLLLLELLSVAVVLLMVRALK